MQLLLVRHARPMVGEAADPPLGEEGNAQARSMAAAVASGRYGSVTAVVSSTQLRAIQTAEPLAAALGVVAETDVRLVEIDHGWSSYPGGKIFGAYATRGEAYRAINRGVWGANTFDPAAFRERVCDGIEAVVARHPGPSVAVVCHGGVISAYLAHVLGVRDTVFFAPDFCSISRVLADPDGHRELLTANETGVLWTAAGVTRA